MNIKSVLNPGGGKSGGWNGDGNGRDKSLVDGGKRGFVLEIKSGNLLFNDDGWCCSCSPSFLLSDGDNLSFERCCWW